MRHPTKGLILKSRTIKLIKYTNIFKASDAMNWILENFKFITTRSKARGKREKNKKNLLKFKRYLRKNVTRKIN